MNKLLASAFLVLLGISTAHAGVIAQYEVSNYHNSNGTSAAHGLYTFGAYSPQTFTIDALFTISEDILGVKTATLNGTIDNQAGETGTINLVLGDWQDVSAYKVEGGAPNPVNADFFRDISGIIKIGTDTFSGIHTCSACDNNAGYSFQYGLGANAKNPNEIGASAWIQYGAKNGLPNSGQTGTSHWDLNLAFSTVPEPGTLALLGLGLLGLGFNRRKNA